MKQKKKEKPKLTIELVPSTSWYSNLRSELPQHQWNKIRKAAYKKNNYKCAICGGVGPNWPVEAHEIWEYDDEKHIQKLIDVLALCPNCHMVKHIGLAMIQGNLEKALSHLQKVNRWDRQQATEYIDECMDLHQMRSIYLWELDISWVKENG